MILRQPHGIGCNRRATVAGETSQMPLAQELVSMGFPQRIGCAATPVTASPNPALRCRRGRKTEKRKGPGIAAEALMFRRWCRVDQYFATMASLPNFQLMATRLIHIESLFVNLNVPNAAGPAKLALYSRSATST